MPKKKSDPTPTAADAMSVEQPFRFADLHLHPTILDAIRDAGYTSPTPIQREAIPIALNGRYIMGLAQTGTGKTAAFTLPIIERLIDGPRRTRALILATTVISP